MRSSSASMCWFRAHGRSARHARRRNVLSLSRRRLGLEASPSERIEKLARSSIGQDVRPFAQRSVRRRLPSERRLAAREDTLWLENRPRAPSFDWRSCVLSLSRSARHLAVTRQLDTKRRTAPCLAFSASPFVETPGASKMPRFDFSKRQVPRAPGEPLRIPLETWSSFRSTRARARCARWHHCPASIAAIVLAIRVGRRWTSPDRAVSSPCPGSWREAFEHFPAARALVARSGFDGWRHAPAGPKVSGCRPIHGGWRET